MLEVKIPDFLKLKQDEEPSRLYALIKEYENKFGKNWSTEPYDFDDEELERIFEMCINENRTFYDVIGENLSKRAAELDEDEDW